MFAKNMAGYIMPLFIDSCPYSSYEEDSIKSEIKKTFGISAPLFNINIFKYEEEKNIYNFIVNDILTINLDPNIKQVRHFLDTYKKYIIEMNISKDEKIILTLYEGDCRWNKDKYYLGDENSFKYCSINLNNSHPYIVHIPDIRDGRGNDKRNKFDKAIIVGLESNKKTKEKICFKKEDIDDNKLFIDDIVKDIKEKLENLKSVIPSTFDIIFEA
jgi:hypothetical protein